MSERTSHQQIKIPVDAKESPAAVDETREDVARGTLVKHSGWGKTDPFCLTSHLPVGHFSIVGPFKKAA